MSSKLNVLIAYPYMKKNLIEGLIKNEDKINFLLDSGAFTAWKSGNPIKLDDYCKFLDSLPIKPWKYFTLDVIGDPKATMENYKEMIKRGYNPIPVFTPSQQYDEIEEYYETTDIIGVGGLTDKYGNSGLIHLKKVFEKTKGRAVHLLGYTRPDFIKYFRPYSCDSSSWTRAQRYGLCDIYVGQGNYIQWTRKQAINEPKPVIVEAIKRLGFELSDFQKEENWRKSTNIASIVSTRSWIKLMIDMDKNIKTKLFLAMGDLPNLDRALTEWRYWNE